MSEPSTLEYPPILIGQGLGVLAPEPGSRTRKDREYVVGPTGAAPLSLPQAIPIGFDELSRRFGTGVYESMLVDPAVSSSFELLKLGVLSSGLKLAPAVAPKPGVDPESDPKTKQAAEVVALCERALRSCDTAIEPLCFELLDAMAFGNRIAEITYRVVESGEDRGKLFPARIKPKPKGSLSFVVDSTAEVLALQATSAETGAPVLLPLDKFLVWSWQCRDGDPRGTSILRAAYDAWSMKIQTWPELYASLQQFGSPSLIGVTAEGETEHLPEDDDGNPIEGGTPVSAQAYLAQQLAKFRNGRAIAVPFGTTVTVVGGQAEGKAFQAALELFNREIVLAILKNTRTTLEAQHGSKADSATGQDVTGLTIGYARADLCRAIRDQLLWQIVSLNLGDDVANEFTPLPSFGETEGQDIPAIASAIAALMRVGFFTESQLPHVDALLGLPPRNPGDVRVSATGSGSTSGADPATDPNAEPDPTEVPPKSKKDAKP